MREIAGETCINPAFQVASRRRVNWFVKADKTATNRKQVSRIAVQCYRWRSSL